MGNLLQAIAIVLVVMLISLGLRTGLVVAPLIPVAMLMSLLVMYVLGVGSGPDVAGRADHLAGHADRQRDRDVRVDHGADRRGQAAGPGGGRFGPRAARAAADLVADHVGRVPADLPGQVQRRRVHRRAVRRGHDHAALLVGPGADHDAAAVRQVPARRSRKAETRLRGPVLPRLPRHAAVRAAASGAGAGRGGGCCSSRRSGWPVSCPQLFFPKADRSFFTTQLDLPTGVDIGATERDGRGAGGVPP